MQIRTEQFEIEVIDDPMYSFGSADNSRQYAKEYLLGENYKNAPRYGITVKVATGSMNSCIVLANGGSTSAHDHSALVIDDFLFVAVSRLIACLKLPTLDLIWHRGVDLVTCFGIFVSPDQKALISHGETEIAKVSFDGEIEWSTAGKDIFTEGFSLFPDHIEAIDFNHEKYRIELSNGQISLRNGG